MNFFNLNEVPVLSFRVKKAGARLRDRDFFIQSTPSDNQGVDPLKREEVKREEGREGENPFKRGTKIRVQLHRSLTVGKKLSILCVVVKVLKVKMLVLLVIQITGTYLYVLNEEFLDRVKWWFLEAVFEPVRWFLRAIFILFWEFCQGSTSFRESVKELNFEWTFLIYDLRLCSQKFPRYSARHSPWNRARFLSFLRAFWKEFQSDSGLELIISRNPLKTIIMSLAIMWVFWNLEVIPKPQVVKFVRVPDIKFEPVYVLK